MRRGDSLVTFTGFTTIIPPNGPSCNAGGEDGEGAYTAGSFHPGIVQVALGDGSARSISETINAGTIDGGSRVSGQSNYGVWGALGTRAGGEVTDEF